jgi:hypothetical protein
MHQRLISIYLHYLIAVGRRARFFAVGEYARQVIVECEDMVTGRSI